VSFNGIRRFVAFLLAGALTATAATLVQPAQARAYSQARAIVNAPSTPLNVRSGPARTFRKVGALADGTVVVPVCQVTGQLGAGTERRTKIWDKLPDGGYVSDGYIRHSGSYPACAATAARPHWSHPLPGFPVQGGFRTALRPTHQGIDIMAFRGTPVHAAGDGVVLEVVCDSPTGASCDLPGTPTTRGCGWFVKLGHPGGVATLYCHLLRRPTVRPGQRVLAGDVIGLVGTSGRTSFPHLHFEVHTNAPPTHPWNAVDPMAFMASVGAPLPWARG
jgi:murein DD-endopeptidase MepM/ murein hydrolase activator NlpD